MKFEQIKDNKDLSIKFRVTKQQKDLIKKVCKERNLKLSEYILSLIEKDINSCR